MVDTVSGLADLWDEAKAAAMSEPESEPKPEAKVEAKPAPGKDAARVYDQLSFDRAPVLRTVAAGEPSTARALLLGLGAAILGAAVFFLVRWITGYELGLISIVVGIGIGVAVRTGAKVTGIITKHPPERRARPGRRRCLRLR